MRESLLVSGQCKLLKPVAQSYTVPDLIEPEFRKILSEREMDGGET